MPDQPPESTYDRRCWSPTNRRRQHELQTKLVDARLEGSRPPKDHYLMTKALHSGSDLDGIELAATKGHVVWVHEDLHDADLAMEHGRPTCIGAAGLPTQVCPAGKSCNRTDPIPSVARSPTARRSRTVADIPRYAARPT